MKRFFRATLNPSPPSQPVLDENGCYNPELTTESLKETYRNWTPPMDPPLPDLPVDRKTLDWADANNIDVHPAIRRELELGPKFDSQIWEPVLHPITPEDIKNQCKGRNTSPGISRISYRMILYSAPHLLELLASTLTEILDNGCIPDILKQALLRPIPKSEGIPIETASRPITILECSYKLFSGILANRLQGVIGKHQPLFAGQYAFMQNKRIETPIKTKLDIEELARELQAPLYVVELDISKAYDHTRSHLLEAGVHRLGFPSCLQKLLANMRAGAFSHLLIHKDVEDKIQADTLRQGCPLACLSFNIQLDILLTALDRELQGFSCDGLPAIKVQAYADDIATFHGTLDDVRKALAICQSFCALHQQRINAKKSFLRVIHGPPPATPIRINGEPITVVETNTPTRYLGLYTSPNGSLDATRRHVFSIIERAACQLKGKQTSSALRTLVINRSLAPKLKFMLSKFPLRILDLEAFTGRLQKLVTPDVESTTSEALYCPYSQGGAGLFHLATQTASGYIQNLLEELNSNPARLRSDLLSNMTWDDDPLLHNSEKLVHRGRNQAISYFTQTSTLCLLKLAQKSLHTLRSPLGIPVSRLTAESQISLSSVTTAREYLAYLQCTVLDSAEDIIIHQDIHDLVSLEDVLKFIKSGKQHTLSTLPQLVLDGWKLVPTAPEWRTATQLA
jgi:hypothetical protein